MYFIIVGANKFLTLNLTVPRVLCRYDTLLDQQRDVIDSLLSFVVSVFFSKIPLAGDPSSRSGVHPWGSNRCPLWWEANS
jgi:hypothetical protein